MRRAAILLLATFMLLFVVACNNDPYVYKYDSTSYLGSWEINIAPIEGDVDGCIQLRQFEFRSDLTYGVVEYLYDAQTKIVQIVDGAEGTFEYDYDEDTNALFCHMGWNGSTTHVTIESQNFSIYKTALAIDFNISHSDSNNFATSLVSVLLV